MTDVKATMTPDRAADLDRTKDTDYQNLSELQARYELHPKRP